jgi:hypothetical protein
MGYKASQVDQRIRRDGKAGYKLHYQPIQSALTGPRHLKSQREAAMRLIPQINALERKAQTAVEMRPTPINAATFRIT